MGQYGPEFRRSAHSPRPKRILELDVINLPLDQKVIMICAGGGIPVVQKPDGTMIDVAAVINKDHASGFEARQINADVFLMHTDVEGVFAH